MRESDSIDRISTFFEGIARTRGLRAALVIDDCEPPAGLDPIIESRLDGGVAVLRASLHPKLSLRLPSWMKESPCGRLVDGLESSDPLDGLCPLASALRRISRLHSVLLVIDDLQEMDHAMRGEFSMFLAALADETLSVLCFSRSADPSIRGMIERYLLDEIRLQCRECDDQPATVRSSRVMRLLDPSARLRASAYRKSPGLSGSSATRWYQSAVDSLDSTLALPKPLESRLQSRLGRGGENLSPEPELSAPLRAQIEATESIPDIVEGADLQAPNRGKLRISVVGEFAIHHPDGTTIPIRGERLRVVLGVLIIDRMLATPLSAREFCRLSSGDVDEPVRAQKIMNMGVKRLQEVLGDNAIVRRGETPQLDLDVVSVDLLQAHQLLRDAQAARQHGPLMRAVDQLVVALDIVRGEQLFPELEGGMYEAAREEFAENLRSAIVDVVRLLREEGEHKGVEPVLRRAIESVPEDEQIIELWHEVVGEGIEVK